MASCGSKIKKITSNEAEDALKNQSLAITTCQGRAWISVKSPQQKISFPANIWIERTNPVHSLLRIEIMDPLGVTHALLILRFVDVPVSPGVKKPLPILIWADFDAKKISESTETWNGLSLQDLPSLILGIFHNKDMRLSSVSADELEYRQGDALTALFQFRWIDPGPRLALSGIRVEQKSKEPNNLRYEALFSKFLDKPDFYLAQEVELKADQTEIHLSWRERKWNEPVGNVFVLPTLNGFSKE